MSCSVCTCQKFSQHIWRKNKCNECFHGINLHQGVTIGEDGRIYIDGELSSTYRPSAVNTSMSSANAAQIVSPIQQRQNVFGGSNLTSPKRHDGHSTTAAATTSDHSTESGESKSKKAGSRRGSVTAKPTIPGMIAEPKPYAVKALYSHTGSIPEQLSFKRGEILEIDGHMEGWLSASVLDQPERRGWVPNNYVERLAEGTVNLSSGKKSRSRRGSINSVKPGQQAVVSPGPQLESMSTTHQPHETFSTKLPVLLETLYDFVAEFPDQQLSFQKGDVFVLQNKEDADWWDVKNPETGKVGAVPALYVRELTAAHIHQSIHQELIAAEEAEQRGEAVMVTEPVVQKVPQPRRASFFAKQIAIPSPPLPTEAAPTSNNVATSATPATTTASSVPIGATHRAGYAFTATTAGQLTYERGDYLTLVSKDHEGWWRFLHHPSGQQGLVASNYVKELTADEKSVDEAALQRQRDADAAALKAQQEAAASAAAAESARLAAIEEAARHKKREEEAAAAAEAQRQREQREREAAAEEQRRRAVQEAAEAAERERQRIGAAEAEAVAERERKRRADEEAAAAAAEALRVKQAQEAEERRRADEAAAAAKAMAEIERQRRQMDEEVKERERQLAEEREQQERERERQRLAAEAAAAEDAERQRIAAMLEAEQRRQAEEEERRKQAEKLRLETEAAEAAAAAAALSASQSAAASNVTFPLHPALFDFTATVAGQASLIKGELVEVHDKGEHGWWTIKNQRGELGMAPSNYISPNEASATNANTTPTQTPKRASVIASSPNSASSSSFNFNLSLSGVDNPTHIAAVGFSPSEAARRQSAIINNLASLGLAKENQYSVLPRNGTEAASSPITLDAGLPSSAVDSTCQAIALFSFTATVAGQLSFAKNDVLQIIQPPAHGWLLARDQKGVEGNCPENYFKFVPGENTLPQLTRPVSASTAAPSTSFLSPSSLQAPGGVQRRGTMMSSTTPAGPPPIPSHLQEHMKRHSMSGTLSIPAQSPSTSSSSTILESVTEAPAKKSGPPPLTREMSEHVKRMSISYKEGMNGEVATSPATTTSSSSTLPSDATHRAIYPFTATETGQLSYAKGDIFTFLSKDHEGWWRFKHHASGLQGLVASNYVKEIPEDEKPAASPTATSASSSLTTINETVESTPITAVTSVTDSTPSNSTAASQQHLVLFDFTGTVAGQLSVKKGELVEVQEKGDHGWWTVKNSTGVVGMAPSNYISPEATSASTNAFTPIAAAASSITPSDSDSYEGVALYDYTAQTGDQLSLTRGQQLTITPSPHADWVMARSSVASGLIPASYIHRVIERVRTLYPFVADPEKNLLGFEVGAIIRVTQATDATWSLGWKENTTESGLFPLNYVEKI